MREYINIIAIVGLIIIIALYILYKEISEESPGQLKKHDRKAGGFACCSCGICHSRDNSGGK